MKSSLKNISFKNTKNPDTKFDIASIESIIGRAYDDHSPFELHKLSFFAIVFIQDGQSMHTIDFTDYSCTKGTLLTIRKDQIHKFFKSNSIKGLMLLFMDDFLVSYLEEIEAEKTLILFNELLGAPKLQLNDDEFEEVNQLMSRLQNEYFNTNDSYSLSIIRSELHILVTKLFRIKSKKEKLSISKKYLKEFVAFQSLVEKNATKTTKVKDYALELGVSTKTLNTITKSIVHKPAKDFIDDVCIKQIKRLLINTKISVKEIAYQTGFEETTNFYKYFKRNTQLTPEQFREHIR